MLVELYFVAATLHIVAHHRPRCPLFFDTCSNETACFALATSVDTLAASVPGYRTRVPCQGTVPGYRGLFLGFDGPGRDDCVTPRTCAASALTKLVMVDSAATVLLPPLLPAGFGLVPAIHGARPSRPLRIEICSILPPLLCLYPLLLACSTFLTVFSRTREMTSHCFLLAVLIPQVQHILGSSSRGRRKEEEEGV